MILSLTCILLFALVFTLAVAVCTDVDACAAGTFCGSRVVVLTYCLFPIYCTYIVSLSYLASRRHLRKFAHFFALCFLSAHYFLYFSISITGINYLPFVLTLCFSFHFFALNPICVCEHAYRYTEREASIANL